MNQPNVLWIMTDQQQSRAMGLLDSSYKTPHLDDLARSGVRFDKHITVSAQCTPARAAWMTGQYPHQVGVNQLGHALSTDRHTVAKEFRKAGYETAYFGKWHLYTPVEQHGFDITEYEPGPYLDYGGGIESEDSIQWSHLDGITAAQALNYLEKRDSGKPFFTVVSWHMPHPGTTFGPFELIERYAHEFDPAAIPVPSSFYTDDLNTKPDHQRLRAQDDQCRLTEQTVREDAQKYRSMLRLMDWHLGRLLDMLDRQDLTENTIVLFTSDHGDMQGAHRLRLKGVVPYRELYEVPLLLRIPKCTRPGQVVSRLTSSAAVPGTLLDAAGIPVPDCFEGGSLLPLLADSSPQKAKAEDYVFFEHYKAYWGFHPFRGIQTPKWKYVYYYMDDKEEMYDLAQDPDEVFNVAAREDLAALKANLKSMVDEWWEQTGALSVQPVKVPETGKWAELV